MDVKDIMNTLRTLLAATLIAATAGCASGLNSAQQSEMRFYQANNLEVQEKSPGVGAGLGLLPGGGSFYGRSYGYGVVNLLLWPLSILWDPVSGYDAAEAINYEATRTHVRQLRSKELDQLESQLTSNEIDLKAYTLQKRKIEEKYQAL